MRLLDRQQLTLLLRENPVFELIGQVADEQGVECYVVGGYVRDLFLERPSKDIDVVCVGSGIELAKAVARRLGRGAHVSVFRNFGTAQVKAFIGESAFCAVRGESTCGAVRGEKGEELLTVAKQPSPSRSDSDRCEATIELEFVGARRESYSHDSRKPIVEDGTLEDDQQRRDFTINAMAICLNTARFGELVDPFDGVWDMQDRLIATPLDPDVTFSDDPLRMMRCIRFATQLNFEIEPETFEALNRNRERIKIISGERIIDELQKIMASDSPARGFELLFQCGLLELIFPELYALQGIDTVNGRAHKDNFWHTLEVLTNVVKKQQTQPLPSGRGDKEESVWLRWAALLHDIGKPKSKRWDPQLGWTFHNHNYIGEKMVPQIFRRLKLPMDERMKYVQKLVSLHMRPIAIADDEVTDSAVRRLLFEAGDDIDDLMLLCEADITSKNEQRKQRFLDNFKLVRQKLIDLEERDRIRNFQPPVSGEEIMEHFHLPPSREVGTLKTAVKDAILDGLIPNDHDAALAFIIEKAKKLGITT